MHFETLKFSKRKYFLYALVVGVALLLPLVLTFSRAKYKTTESIKIVEGTIRNYNPADFSILAMYQENASGTYEEIEIMPTGSYIINEEKSYCKVNGKKDQNAILETYNGRHTIANLQKRSNCYLYFDKAITNAQELIAAHTFSTRTDFSTVLTADTTGTIYEAEDDYGTSYYFAGAPTDNWVRFAGYYWRIIRINGDGTIRMIYQGTAANTTGTGTQTTTSAFNSSYDNNMYVGYMYTSGSVHGRGTTSKIKGALDTWNTNNLSGYASYIATGKGATFCNDRQPSTIASSINGSGGTGTTTTYYAAYIRLVTNKTPSFKCVVNNDRFSTSIGLITADEVSYAGGKYGGDISNSSYYLYTGQYYWTMSPFSYDSNIGAIVFHMEPDGYMGTAYTVDAPYGVRPVINLKSDVTFVAGGTGTSSNPYVVS